MSIPTLRAGPARRRAWPLKPARRPAERAPRPPTGLGWALASLDVPAGTVLFRIGNVRYPGPAYFGRVLTYRFDSPDRSYGVCYLGTTLACFLLETIPLGKRRRTRTRFIQAEILGQRYGAYATPRRDLRLAWLTDAGLVRNGADVRGTGAVPDPRREVVAILDTYRIEVLS